MKTKINIYAEDWCNLVFEGKNKDYGAFAIRTHSNEQKIKALLITIILAISIACIPLLKKAPVLPVTNDRPSDPTVFSNPPDLPQEPLKPKLPESLPPKAAIGFTQLVISNNDVSENVPPMDDLIGTKKAIGPTSIDGADDLGTIGLKNRNITDNGKKDTIFTVIEKMPQFPGGPEAFARFLRNNLRFPEIAKENEISGKVFAQFVVYKTGEIRNIKIVRGLDASCNEETIRILKLMPHWTPGMQNDKPVSVYFTLPVFFLLDSK
jgi:protein TonB